MKLIFLISVIIVFLINFLNVSNGQLAPACPAPFLFRPSNSTLEDSKLGYIYIPKSDQLPTVLSFLNNCLMPCQSMLFEDKSWVSFNNLVNKMGTVSFVCSVIVMIIYGPLFNRFFFKGDRHTMSIFFFALSTFFIGVSDLMLVAQDDNEIRCPESHRYARQTDEKCATNGILFMFGWIGVIYWFAVMAVDGYLRASGRKPNKKLFGIVVASLYALIFILTFIPMKSDQYGYFPVGQNNCWVLEKNWQYAVFWAELIVCLAIGFFSIVLSIYSISTKTNDGNKFKYIGATIFSFILLCEILYMICFFGIINQKEDIYTDKLAVRIGCIYNNFIEKLLKGPAAVAQECKFETTITFSSQYAFLFFIRFIGIQLFSAHVFSNEAKLLIRSSWIAEKLGFGDKDAYDIELNETD